MERGKRRKKEMIADDLRYFSVISLAVGLDQSLEVALLSAVPPLLASWLAAGNKDGIYVRRQIASLGRRATDRTLYCFRRRRCRHRRRRCRCRRCSYRRLR